MIAGIADRLRAAVPALVTVRGVVDLASMVDGKVRHALPAAFVHVQADQDQGTLDWSQQSQIVARQIGVLVAGGGVGEDRGQDQGDTLQAVLDTARAALLGFVPDGAREPLTFAGGDLVRVGGGTVLWLDAWRTSFLLTSEAASNG